MREVEPGRRYGYEPGEGTASPEQFRTRRRLAEAGAVERRDALRQPCRMSSPRIRRLSDEQRRRHGIPGEVRIEGERELD